MLRDRFVVWLPSVLLIAFFVLPAILIKVDIHDAVTTGNSLAYSMIPLLLTNPAVIVLLAVVCGIRYQVRGLIGVALVLIAFAISAVVVYPSSALGYLPFYIPGAALGWFGGFAWLRVIEHRRAKQELQTRADTR